MTSARSSEAPEELTTPLTDEQVRSGTHQLGKFCMPRVTFLAAAASFGWIERPMDRAAHVEDQTEVYAMTRIDWSYHRNG